jgi:hypothetical protein
MDPAIAVILVLIAATAAVWLLTRVFKTLIELRKMANGLNVLGWALGQIRSDPAGQGSLADGPRRRMPGSG